MSAPLEPSSRVGGREAEVAGKQVHDVVHPPDHGVETIPQAHPVEYREGISFYDIWFDSKVGLILDGHGRFPAFDAEQRDYAFVFDWSGVRFDVPEPRGLGQHEAREAIGAHRTHDVEMAVPVAAGEVVEQPESVPHVVQLRSVSIDRCTVRLFFFNPSPVLLGKRRDLPCAALEVIDRVHDRKLDLLLVGGRILTTVEYGGLVKAAVQGRTEVVKQLAQIQGEISGAGLDLFNGDRAFPIWLYFDGHGVATVLDEGAPFRLNGLGMRPGPFDALPATIKRQAGAE